MCKNLELSTPNNLLNMYSIVGKQTSKRKEIDA